MIGEPLEDIAQATRSDIPTAAKKSNPLSIVEEQCGQASLGDLPGSAERLEQLDQVIDSEHEPIMREMYRKSQGSISRSTDCLGAGIIPRMDNQQIRERITKRLEEIGKSARAASLDSGMSADAIRDIFRKQDSSPTIETLRKLAVGLETTPEWLAFGLEGIGSFGWRPSAWKSQSGDAAQVGDGRLGQPEIVISKQNTVMVPVVGIVEAGAFREAPEYEPDEFEYLSEPPDREYPHARIIGFDVAGDSMNDLKPRPLLPGDRVIALDFSDVEGMFVLRNDLVVVVEQTRDGGHTREWSVKQLEIYEDRYEFCPRSTNKRHKPIVVPKKVFHDPSEEDGRQVRILALVRRASTVFTY
jgi:transcriptional regulator with XRE-family HTH domain